MTAYPLQILLRRPGDTADVIADLTPGDTVDHALAYHHANRRQLGPQAQVSDPARVGDHTTRAGLLATALDLFRLALGEVHTGLAVLQGLLKRVLDVLIEMGLVLLDSQHVLAPFVDDSRGDLFLTAHGIDRHHGPFQIQQLEQFGNGRDLVRFRIGRDLAQGQVVLHRPGADQVQGRLTDRTPRRTTLGLPINGDGPQFRPRERDGGQAMPFHQCGHPVGETRLEGQRVEEAEDATEGIVRRHTPRQGQKGFQPVALRLSVIGDLEPAIGSTEDGANGHEHDLIKHVDLSLFAARIRKRGEVFRIEAGSLTREGDLIAMLIVMGVVLAQVW
jgi:hypothetical protein